MENILSKLGYKMGSGYNVIMWHDKDELNQFIKEKTTEYKTLLDKNLISEEEYNTYIEYLIKRNI